MKNIKCRQRPASDLHKDDNVANPCMFLPRISRVQLPRDGLKRGGNVFSTPCWCCTAVRRSDTNPLDGGEEKAFATALQRRGLDTFVVPVQRSEWLNVAAAILTLDFWKGTCRPDGAYNWYLQKASVGALAYVTLLIHRFNPPALGSRRCYFHPSPG